jgi:hypothetical protein
VSETHSDTCDCPRCVVALFRAYATAVSAQRGRYFLAQLGAAIAAVATARKAEAAFMCPAEDEDADAPEGDYPVICSACDGTGEAGRTGRLRCSPCRGTGEVIVREDGSVDEHYVEDARTEYEIARAEDRAERDY